MKWEVKKTDNGLWGVYLCKEFWRYPDKPVCYSASKNIESAQLAADRMNNPDYWNEEEE
jgi:hypothetical protein